MDLQILCGGMKRIIIIYCFFKWYMNIENRHSCKASAGAIKDNYTFMIVSFTL